MKSQRMVAIVVCFLLCAAVFTHAEEAEEQRSPWAGDQELAVSLEKVRSHFDLPALAGAILTNEGIQCISVVGVRKKDSDVPASLNDQWHLGSNTKAMTATLIAMLTEEGKLEWETTMADVFPDLRDQFHEDACKITLVQLLSHRAGLPANTDYASHPGEDMLAVRRELVQKELAKEPEAKPGTRTLYSNLGYIIAGAVIEKVLETTWEKAISEHLFKPLKMKESGFGGVGTLGKIDQPWSHRDDGTPVEINGPEVDNPKVLGPAGRVHGTMQDWALFVTDQLRGARGESSLLKSDSYRIMHTPQKDSDLALGWMAVERDWGGGMVLNHTGSNTVNFANVWVAPKKNYAVLACTNQGGDKAYQATDAAVGALIQHHAALNEKKENDEQSGMNEQKPD